jgi:hypothetical protein
MILTTLTSTLLITISVRYPTDMNRDDASLLETAAHGDSVSVLGTISGWDDCISNLITSHDPALSNNTRSKERWGLSSLVIRDVHGEEVLSNNAL